MEYRNRSAKSLIGLFLGIVLMLPVVAEPAADHFFSYEVEGSKGSTKFKPRQATLRDRFGEGKFVVQSPTRLLNPTSWRCPDDRAEKTRR